MGRARDPRYRQLVERLRAARETVRLTQTEVARRLGKPQSFISKVESGERRLDVIELLDFAQLYGRSVTGLLPMLQVREKPGGPRRAAPTPRPRRRRGPR